MKDGTIRALGTMAAVIGTYGIYAFTNPSTDGVVFGTVMTALGAIGGYAVGKASSE